VNVIEVSSGLMVFSRSVIISDDFKTHFDIRAIAKVKQIAKRSKLFIYPESNNHNSYQL
jgi:hypothetical protein